MPKFNKDKDVNEFSMENPLQPVKNMAYWKAKNNATSPLTGKFKEFGKEHGGKILGALVAGNKNRQEQQKENARAMQKAYLDTY